MRYVIAITFAYLAFPLGFAAGSVALSAFFFCSSVPWYLAYSAL
jgi:hypothetical protein